MKFDLEQLSQLERRLHIEVPLEKVSEAFEKVYKTIQQQVTIKGFRKGKAPLSAVKSMYKDKVSQDVVQDLVQEYYGRALQEKSLEPITYPNIHFDFIDEEKPFTFKAQFEVRPEVTLKNYEGLEVEKEKLEVDQKSIDNTLERMRQSRAQEVPLLIDRPAQKGDIVTIDFEGTMDGQKLENGSASQQAIELGASGFIPGFDEGIEGMSLNQTRDINVNFPEDYHATQLAGKPATFKITVQKISKKELPELNDEFAASVSTHKTMTDLRTAIEADYVKATEARIKKDLKNRILKLIVEKNPVEIPPTLLKEQKQNLLHDFHQRMEQQGMTHEQYQEYITKWDKDFEDSARNIIQASFIINAIADKHTLRGTEHELEAKLEEYAKQTGIEIARLKEYYGKTEQKANLRFQITEEKVVDYILSRSKLKEVDAAKLKDKEEA